MGPPQVSDTACFLEDEGEKVYQPVLTKQTAHNKNNSVSTSFLVSGTFYVPSHKKPEVQKDGVRKVLGRLTWLVRI